MQPSLPHPLLFLCTPPPPPPLLFLLQYTGVRWLRLRFTLAPPLIRFCPNRAFCVAGAPDFRPTSSARRGKRWRRWKSHREERARVREGGGRESFTTASTDISSSLPPSLPFTSVLVRRVPPCSGGVPGYITDPRAESPNQIYGLRTSVQETANTACTPRGGSDIQQPASTELDAVAELRQTQSGQEEVSKPGSGNNSSWDESLLSPSFSLHTPQRPGSFSRDTERQQHSRNSTTPQLSASAGISVAAHRSHRPRCTAQPKEHPRLGGTRSTPRSGTWRTCCPSPMQIKRGSRTCTSCRWPACTRGNQSSSLKVRVNSLWMKNDLLMNLTAKNLSQERINKCVRGGRGSVLRWGSDKLQSCGSSIDRSVIIDVEADKKKRSIDNSSLSVVLKRSYAINTAAPLSMVLKHTAATAVSYIAGIRCPVFILVITMFDWLRDLTPLSTFFFPPEPGAAASLEESAQFLLFHELSELMQALPGFLMLLTGEGKLLYMSDSVSEHLGHSMVSPGRGKSFAVWWQDIQAPFWAQ